MLQAFLLAPLVSKIGDRWLGQLPWWTPFKTEDVETLKQLIAAGQLKPFIARRYPLAQVVDAPLCRGRPCLRQGRHRLVATVGQIREEV